MIYFSSIKLEKQANMMCRYRQNTAYISTYLHNPLIDQTTIKSFDQDVNYEIIYNVFFILFYLEF